MMSKSGDGGTSLFGNTLKRGAGLFVSSLLWASLLFQLGERRVEKQKQRSLTLVFVVEKLAKKRKVEGQ